MSEAITPKEPEQSTPVNPTPPSPPKDKQPSKGNGLAIIALLLGAAGVAVGGWGVWQVRDLETRGQQQLSQLQRTEAQADAVAERAKGLDARLEQLPSPEKLEANRQLVVQLQADQQLLNKRLETVLGASRQEWRLAEAEHLLRLASLRLSALQDINSATALVEAADEILRGQDDPAAYAARQQLAKSLEALHTIANPDRTGLFLQIGALRDQAVQLTALNPVFNGGDGVLHDVAQANYEAGWWAEWLDKLSQYVRLDFDADQNVRPLLAGQSLVQVRLALSLALEQAQWAALHGQTPVYKQAMRQAAEVLDANFNQDNPSSRALRNRIVELFDKPIEVDAPDLSESLTAVDAYIELKQSARERLKDAAPADEAEAGDASQ